MGMVKRHLVKIIVDTIAAEKPKYIGLIGGPSIGLSSAMLETQKIIKGTLSDSHHIVLEEKKAGEISTYKNLFSQKQYPICVDNLHFCPSLLMFDEKKKNYNEIYPNIIFSSL